MQHSQQKQQVLDASSAIASSMDGSFKDGMGRTLLQVEVDEAAVVRTVENIVLSAVTCNVPGSSTRLFEDLNLTLKPGREHNPSHPKLEPDPNPYPNLNGPIGQNEPTQNV